MVSMSLALISGPYFIKLVRLLVMSILSPGPDSICLSPGPDFIKLVRVRTSILSLGSDLIKAVRKASPGPDFIHRVRVRILSIFESGSGQTLKLNRKYNIKAIFCKLNIS